MSRRNDRNLSAFVSSLEAELWNPNTTPERAGFIQDLLNQSKNRRAYVAASRFENHVHGVLKGQPQRGVIVYGGQSFPRQVDSERMEHHMRIAANKIPPQNKYPLVAVSKNPLSGIYERAVSLDRNSAISRMLNVSSKRNRFDQATPTRHRYGSSTTAIVPWRADYNHEALRNAAQAAFNPLRNAGVGYETPFDEQLFDTNWAYGESANIPPEWAMNMPVTKAQAEAMRSEDKNTAERNEYVKSIGKRHREEEVEREDRLTREIKKRHSSRLARDARRKLSAKENFSYDMMGEFEQRMFDLRRRYGGSESMADDSLRNSLKKELPFFFKNSKLSTKTLFNLSKSFGAIKHLPFGVGKMLGSPAFALAATYAGTVKFLSASDAANKTVTGWANAANLYGTPSQKYQKAARLAGVEDPGTIAKTLGKFSLQYGGRENAESVLEEFGRQMQGMDETQKLYFADALGLSDTDVATAEFLAGGKKAEKFRKVAAAKSALDTVKATGFASGSSFGDTITSVGLAIPGMESALARTHTSESVAAAGNTVSIVLNGPVNVNAEDGEGFVESLVKESDSRSGSAVLSTVDSGEK